MNLEAARDQQQETENESNVSEAGALHEINLSPKKTVDQGNSTTSPPFMLPRAIMRGSAEYGRK